MLMIRLFLTGLLFFLVSFCHFAVAEPANLDQKVGTFIVDFWTVWSQDNQSVLPYLDRTFASSVNFYGNPTTHADLMKTQIAFATRWPTRNYKIAPESLTKTCNQNESTCDISGVVNWIASSPSRDMASVGSANFQMSIFFDPQKNYAPSIVKETGDVIDRTITKGYSSSILFSSDPNIYNGNSKASEDIVVTPQGIDLFPTVNRMNFGTDSQVSINTCKAINGLQYHGDFATGLFDNVEFNTIFSQNQCEIKISISNQKNHVLFKDALLIGNEPDSATAVGGGFYPHISVHRFDNGSLNLITNETSCEGNGCRSSSLRIFSILADAVIPELYITSDIFDYSLYNNTIVINGEYDDGSCEACKPDKNIYLSVVKAPHLGLAVDHSNSDMLYYNQLANDSIYFLKHNYLAISDFQENIPQAENKSDFDYNFSSEFSDSLYPTFLPVGGVGVLSAPQIAIPTVAKYSDSQLESQPAPQSQNPQISSENPRQPETPVSGPQSSWFVLSNDGSCLPYYNGSPANMIEVDKESGLEDIIDIFQSDANGNVVAVKVSEPQGNDIVLTTTFFKSNAACEAYESAENSQLNQLK